MSELLVDKVTFGSNGSQVSPGLTGFRNKIINGNFDIWKRNTTQSTSSYGSDDRWKNENSGSTKEHSQQVFALGQTAVPGNPKFFSRTVVTSVAGAANFVTKTQRIEYVETLAGKTATLSFWAKADSAKNLGYDIYQRFGTGGSPSGNVTASIGNIVLTSTWTRYIITFNVPSVSGKTKGSDANDSFIVRFWFDAGSNYTGGGLTVGQQSGTFDIAQVQLEEGSTATAFEERPIGLELALCYRYFQRLQNNYFMWSGYINTSSTIYYGSCRFPEMRDAPISSSVTSQSPSSFGSTTAMVVSNKVVRFSATSSAGNVNGIFYGGCDLDAEL